jgi:Flp pilus assembly pilin Flp
VPGVTQDPGTPTLMTLIRNILCVPGELVVDERGQDLAEYGIALGIIVAFVVLIAVAIGADVNTLWSTAQSPISSVVNGE